MLRSPAIILAAAALLAARSAGAYCQSSACPPHGPDGGTQGQVCNPPETGDCGVTLQWRQPCVSFDVQVGASKHVDYAAAVETLTQAFATWTSVNCNGGSPSLQVFDFGAVSCDKVEYNQNAGNANILLFRDGGWPYVASGVNANTVDTIALTTVTYDVDTGDIYDADIEVNTYTFPTIGVGATADDAGADFVDLLSVLTHETGHFAGLAHTTASPATMYPSYASGTIDARTPQPDDQAAICAAYPAAREPKGTCTGVPRHGWAPVCKAEQGYARCSASSAPAEGGGGGVLAAIVALAAAITNRRGSRRS